MTTRLPCPDYHLLTQDIKRWAMELGFQQVAVTGTQLDEDEGHLLNWLRDGMHGEMAYMKRHGTRRSRPAEFQPGTVRVISARMDYLPSGCEQPAWPIFQGMPLAAIITGCCVSVCGNSPTG